ncbi:putative disease resistance protein RGA3 [Vitis vinifera]|uniref:Putative disease resistance protein RGA3 n=1 Tax=Vitis vinifera TaxID=29760 RepID=A0A438IUE1_VITVI|nr:putative disease resistance protein RGA3 [Vitis vinifera]
MGAEAEEASTSKKRKFFTNFSTSFNPAHVVFSVKMGSKIREITSRLQDISARKAGLGLEKVTVAAATSAWQRPPPTTPIAYEPRVYGRDEDKTLVLDLLRKVEPNENNVSVISIVGLGGVGKTTLARQVYKYDLAKNFELKAWVCVTDVFDVENITKAILNSVLESDASGSLDFQQVQKKLTDTLAGKTFLLVLDDVWNENCGHWDLLRAPFSVGSKGSKVIVTTRNKNVALMMGAAKNVHKLNPLSEDACWSVFEKHAFEHRDINDHPNLVSIGRKIVGKCGGLPLAAKALGSLLRSKQSEAEWETRCFAYCAMFPKNWKFESQGLVLLWMAEGLIQQPKDSIGELKHLRYLNLSFTRIKSLPDSVSKLYNLQTIILFGCSNFRRLPPNIGNLINLRHLNVERCLNLDEMPQQIGKIFISRLENVVNIQDAIDANLRTKLNVEELIMSWSSWFDNLRNEDTEMEVLLSLQPHTSLKKLDIEAYGGRQFPNWICDPSYSKLVELSIWGCMRCTDLPSVGQLPFLKNFREMKKMEKVVMVKRVIFSPRPVADKRCPRLRLFKLEQKFLRSLPRLQLLEIDDSGVLDCLWENGLGLENLAKLRVLDCNQLVSLEKRKRKGCLVIFNKGFPLMLRRLTIANCKSLSSLPDSSNCSNMVCVLEYLNIYKCPSLICFPIGQLPTTLKELHISYCKNLKSLPEDIEFSALEYVEIWGVRLSLVFQRENYHQP